MQLTAEDEDRRKRRRERNKIAATKCRMKKRERTINLVTESEALESQNIDLKSQVRNLEMQRRNLSDMLKSHSQSCLRPGNFQIPICAVSVTKYLSDMGLETMQGSSGGSGGDGTPKSGRQGSKANQQKIPSMSTLKFNGQHGNRRTHTQTRQSQLAQQLDTPTSNSSTPVTTPTSAGKHQHQHHHQIPTVDLGFCESNDLGIVSDIIMSQQGGYNKTLSTSDCYSISSPDSGFIKSPIDVSNGGYLSTPTSTPVLMKTDYIPNCDGGMVNGDPMGLQLSGHCVTEATTNGSANIEFILKSELVDANDSPYTTVQSADRFLFDGTETFETDIDQQAHVHLQHTQQHLASPIHLLHQPIMKTTHNMLLNNNNNSILSNHNHNHNNHNNGCVMPGNLANMNEFNNHCQPYIDYTLLKGGDFLGHNTEFLALAGDGSDTQFTELTSTDLDSGVTTYTSISNGNGCLA